MALPDPDNRYLLSIAREMQQSARSLGVLSERLSNSSLDEFVEHLKEVMKHQKLITDADKARIKDAKTLSSVLDDLEKQAREFSNIFEKELKKKYGQYEKKVNNSPKYAGNDQKKKQLLARYEERLLREQAAMHGMSTEYLNALRNNIKSIRDEIHTRAQNVGSMERFGKEMDTLGGRLKNSAKSFFTLDNAVDLAKKSFYKHYDQMSSLTERGMLGAMNTINLMSLKLRMLPKDLEDIINRNRELVNQFGGGVEGVRKFSEYFNEVQKDLGHLGPHMKVAAEKFIQLNKHIGYAANAARMDEKTRADSVKSMNMMKKQFQTFSALFGDTPDQYYNLIASQMEEEQVRNRLAAAGSKGLLKMQEEVMVRTEHLKLMGLSNEQIIKFNEKLRNIYDPKADNRNQRYEDARNQMLLYKGTMDNLMRSSDPEMRAAGEEMMKNFGAVQQLFRAKIDPRVSQEQLEKIVQSEAFMGAQAAYHVGSGYSAKMGETDKGYAGIVYGQTRQEARDELGGGVGAALVDALRQGKAVVPDELKEQIQGMSYVEQAKFLLRPENIDKMKEMNKDFLFKNGDEKQGTINQAKVLEAQYTAITELTNLMNNSLTTAIGAAVAALGALAGSAFLAASANAVAAGKTGMGALTSAIGGFTKSVLKGMKIFGIAFAAIAAGKSLYDAFKDYNDGEITDTERNEKIGSATGGLAGAWLGAKAFGAAGTAVAPGIGTAIGAVGGGIAGYFAGDKIGEKVGGLFGTGEKKLGADPEVVKKIEESSPSAVQEPKSLKKGYDRAIEIAEQFSTPNTIKGMNLQQTKAYAGNTSLTESNGRLAVENKYGYIGQYQFGAEALADVGLVDKDKLRVAKRQAGDMWYKGGQAAFLNDPRNWKIEGGKKAYLSNRELQDQAFVKYTNRNVQQGYEAGVLNDASDASMIAAYAKAAHLKGAGNANAYFKRGKDSNDANGTRVSDYARGAAVSMREISGKISPKINPDGKPDMERVSNHEIKGKITKADEKPIVPSLATPTYVNTPQQPLPDMVPQVKFETLSKAAVEDPSKEYTKVIEDRMKVLADSGVAPEKIADELKNMTANQFKMPPISQVKQTQQAQQHEAAKQKIDQQMKVAEGNKQQEVGSEELAELKKHTELLGQIARGIVSGRSFVNPSHQKDKATILNGFGG